MGEIEKVNRGLECHKAGFYEECLKCPYHDDGCETTLCNDALALLKAQMPRVMTLEEVNKHAGSIDPDPIFVEWKGTHGNAWVACSIYIIADMLNAGNRNVRAWTSRPSPEQMRDTPWEGDSDAEYSDAE